MLKLNPKSKYFPNKLGCPFLGFIVYDKYILLNKKFKNKLYKKVKIWNKLYDNGLLDSKKFILSYNSYKGHMTHSNSYKFIKIVNNKLKIKL